MSIQLKFTSSISSDASTLTITDCTGIYSSLNLGGWGSPNSAIGDVATATIKIAKRNSEGTYPTDVTVNAYSTLPSNAGGTFDIGKALYPLGFSDGIYRLIYTVTGVTSSVPFTYSVTIYRTISCSISCCWQKLSLQVCQDTTYNEDLLEQHRFVSIQMRALQASSCDCGNLNDTQTILDTITKFCKNLNCGCC